MLRRPKVFPVSSIGSGQPVVLDDDADKEPENDFSAVNRFIERRDFAWLLAIVAREADEEDCADDPEDDSNGEGDCCDYVVRDCGRRDGDASARELD
jgi:hypothetical protein